MKPSPLVAAARSAAGRVLAPPIDRNRVVAYVKGVEAMGARGSDSWGGSVRLHALEIDGKLLPGVLLSAELSPFVHDEIEVLTVRFAVGPFRTESIDRAVVTRRDGEIVRIHHGWRAVAVRAGRALAATWKEHRHAR